MGDVVNEATLCTLQESAISMFFVMKVITPSPPSPLPPPPSLFLSPLPLFPLPSLSDGIYTIQSDFRQSIILSNKQTTAPLRVIKAGPVTLTRTTWVQFLTSPTHETCLCHEQVNEVSLPNKQTVLTGSWTRGYIPQAGSVEKVNYSQGTVGQ